MTQRTKKWWHCETRRLGNLHRGMYLHDQTKVAEPLLPSFSKTRDNLHLIPIRKLLTKANSNNLCKHYEKILCEVAFSAIQVEQPLGLHQRALLLLLSRSIIYSNKKEEKRKLKCKIVSWRTGEERFQMQEGHDPGTVSDYPLPLSIAWAI